jgi:hypothetical protein
MTPLEEPSNGSAMGFIPLVKLLLLAKSFPLVYICMTGKAQGGNSVVVGFESHAFAVPLLVGMSGNHRAILRTADLTG